MRGRDRQAGKPFSYVRPEARVPQAPSVAGDQQVNPLLSPEHFPVDGTLIEAWATMKSFRPRDGSGEPPAPGRNEETAQTAPRPESTPRLRLGPVDGSNQYQQPPNRLPTTGSRLK